MKLLVITLARNEEKIIPYFIHHYKNIADEIVLVDHESTDNTVDIAKNISLKLNIPLSVFKLKNEGYDEILLKQFKENFYKYFRKNFDVVLVCDTDEFWHHKDGTREAILKCYANKPFVIKPEAYQMVSDNFINYSGVGLTELVKKGARDPVFDKPLCFSINLNIVGCMGMHYADLYDENNKIINQISDSGIKLLHYKLLGSDYRIERIRNVTNNLNDVQRKLMTVGIGSQFECNEKNLKEDYDKWKSKSHDIEI